MWQTCGILSGRWSKMTWIITGVKYKKELKQLVKDRKFGDIWLTDPSFFDPRPFSGSLELLRGKAMLKGEKIDIAVTNHPKRSWFARIEIYPDTGKVVVS
jgi:hypothetical protein